MPDIAKLRFITGSKNCPGGNENDARCIALKGKSDAVEAVYSGIRHLYAELAGLGILAGPSWGASVRITMRPPSPEGGPPLGQAQRKQYYRLLAEATTIPSCRSTTRRLHDAPQPLHGGFSSIIAVYNGSPGGTMRLRAMRRGIQIIEIPVEK